MRVYISILLSSLTFLLAMVNGFICWRTARARERWHEAKMVAEMRALLAPRKFDPATDYRPMQWRD